MDPRNCQAQWPSPLWGVPMEMPLGHIKRIADTHLFFPFVYFPSSCACSERVALSSLGHWELPLGYPAPFTLIVVFERPVLLPLFSGVSELLHPMKKKGRRDFQECKLWGEAASPELSSAQAFGKQLVSGFLISSQFSKESGNNH